MLMAVRLAGNHGAGGEKLLGMTNCLDPRISPLSAVKSHLHLVTALEDMVEILHFYILKWSGFVSFLVEHYNVEMSKCPFSLLIFVCLCYIRKSFVVTDDLLRMFSFILTVSLAISFLNNILCHYFFTSSETPALKLIRFPVRNILFHYEWILKE